SGASRRRERSETTRVVMLGLLQSFAPFTAERIPLRFCGHPPRRTRFAIGSFSLASSSLLRALPPWWAATTLQAPFAEISWLPLSVSSPDAPHPAHAVMLTTTAPSTCVCLKKLMMSLGQHVSTSCASVGQHDLAGLWDAIGQSLHFSL